MTDTGTPTDSQVSHIIIHRDPEPWWARLIPDIRGLVIVGYFGLAARLLYMIEGNPALLKDAAFMTVVTLILATGLGTIATYLFGGTKTGGDVMTAQTKAVINSTPPVTKG